jgi:L-lactate dehydrogenase (cytochrome)
MIFATCEDFRSAARRRLPRFLFEYLDGGANQEFTLRRNTRDLQDIALEQRVLRDVSGVDTSTTLFGIRQALPLILGPVGIAGMGARL